MPSTTPVLQLRLVIRIHQVNDATRLAIAQGPPCPPCPPWPPRDMPWPLAGTMPLAACRWPSLSCASAQGSQSPCDMSMSNHKTLGFNQLKQGLTRKNPNTKFATCHNPPKPWFDIHENLGLIVWLSQCQRTLMI